MFVVVILVAIVLAYGFYKHQAIETDVTKLVSGVTKQVEALEKAASYHGKLYSFHADAASNARTESVRASNIAKKLKDLVS
jgi:hypothetical protein